MNDNKHDFCHLHVHSDASRIDGLGTVHRLVSSANEMGFSHLGLTDHGTLGNTISFAASCRHHNIKPIIGMEAYVEREGERYHLTLLADGMRGFKTLVDLNNIGQKSSDKSKPTFPLSQLKDMNDGIIVLTGCPASPMQELDWSDAYQIARELKSYLGGRLFAEVMFVSSASPWERAYKLAKDVGLKPIVTNDVHFPNKSDASSHEVLTRLKASFSYESKQLYLATPKQLEARVKNIAPEFLDFFHKGVRNSMILANKLEEIRFDGNPSLPFIKNAKSKLRQEAMSNLSIISKESFINETYYDRVQEELEVIENFDLSGYFLILKDIVDFGKANNIRFGPGRGSGVGSLVLYLLGCTTIDPIENGLLFERFLSSKRKEMPDVDTDIESDRRDEILKYAASRWGALPVATYSRYSHKSLTHDLSRYFRVERSLDTLAADNGPESKEFKQIVKNEPKFGDAYNAFIGQIRHIGQHAGGVVIVNKETPVPLERTSNGDLVVAWTEGEYRELSEAGIVKFDLLSLSALSILKRLEDKHGIKADEPEDGHDVFKIFQEGDTVGIFQFAGSQGIIDFTRKVSPNTLNELVAINALYRPGPLDSGSAHHYAEWKKNPRKLHPLIDEFLEETYGIICFQEQFMKIYAMLTTGNIDDADIARKVLSKARPGQVEWEEKFAKLKHDYYEGAKNKGIDKDTSDKLWHEIVTHAGYSFNKSHAFAYAVIAWEMAWWKHFYPVDFYASLLSVDRDEWERYLFDIVRRGIKLVPPHINQSTEDFESDGSVIYMPLSVIKHLGPKGVKEIMAQRPFIDANDFMNRISKRSVPARARRGLLALGAFKGLKAKPSILEVETPPDIPKSEIQKQFMGFMLPDKKLLDAVDFASKNGYIGGIISSKEIRKSQYGDYTVYKMLPEGAFWSRDYTELEVGSHVKVKIKADSGKIISVLSLY